MPRISAHRSLFLMDPSMKTVPNLAIYKYRNRSL